MEDVYIEQPERVSRFRRAAAKINYLSLDDPRVGYASKQISQLMANPFMKVQESSEPVLKPENKGLYVLSTLLKSFEWS